MFRKTAAKKMKMINLIEIPDEESRKLFRAVSIVKAKGLYDINFCIEAGKIFIG